MDSGFGWDAEKARKNLAKHGISFETARLAFADPFALVEQDRIEGGEFRWRTLGIVNGVTLLLVAHSYPDDDDGTVRIISARRATPGERKHYERNYRAQHS